MGEFDPKLKLHLRFPVRIEEELQVKDLHKNICRVWLPRQKSRRWCIVGFKSFDELTEARDDLKKQKINGKKITIKPFTQGSSQIKRKVAVQAAADIVQFQSLLELAKRS